MTDNRITQAKVVTTQSAISQDQGVLQLALFNPDGSALTIAATPDATTSVKGKVLKGANVTDVAAANGSDLATTQALANETKTKLNALFASLRAAGHI